MSIKELVLDFIFPKYCIFCGLGNSYLCHQCKASKFDYYQTQYCHVCKQEILEGFIHSQCKKQTKLAGVFVVLHYNKFAKQLLKEIKYDLYYAMVPEISEMLKQKYSEINTKLDLVVPIPLHKKKRWERGFNQVELFIKAFSKPDIVLIRKKQTITQVNLSRKERLINIKDAFIVTGNVNGKNILLVDDVMTSGATLEEAAVALKQAGAARVYALVWARD